MERVDAIVLAGDRRGSKPINHQNKAFLVLHGRPIVMHVVGALLRAQRIRRVILVGPSTRLSRALEDTGFSQADRGRIAVVKQGKNLLQNAQYGFIASVQPSAEPSPSLFMRMRGTELDEASVLYLSCDLPLLTPHEVDEFLMGADMSTYDYAVGLSSESVMSYYYPTDSTPGIRMAYYHVREGRFRHNNLHVGKPLKVQGLQYVERMYELRYQKRFLNIVMAVGEAMRAQTGSARLVKFYVQLQIARWLSGTKLRRLYEAFRTRNGLRSILAAIGSVMEIKVQPVITGFGGATLDVDSARDLATINAMYDEWMEHQERIRDAAAGAR